MNLNQLLKLRNELRNAISLIETSKELDKNVHNLNYIVNEFPDTVYANEIKSIVDQHYHALNFINTDAKKISDICKKIQKDIDNIATKFFTNNYHLELECNFESDKSTRKLYKMPGMDDLLINRINLHSTVRYPALEIGCKEGDWTKFLVASDPLYIADRYTEFINIASSQFTPEYRNRIRPYIIKKNYMIEGLPVDQFNFIFSYNYFNYLSLDSIKQLLIQSMSWLRPGGFMLFTYNNCDLPAAASYAESYFMSYVPKSLLIPMCESLGFEISESYDHEPAFSWIEIRKPGILQTIKVQQTLGEIKYM